MNLTTRKEKIQFGEKKILGIFKKKIEFIVEADVPEGVLKEYAEIAEMENNNGDFESQHKMFVAMKKVINTILSAYNKKRKVKKFVDTLGVKSAGKIYTFLSNYMNEGDEEKKND